MSIGLMFLAISIPIGSAMALLSCRDTSFAWAFGLWGVAGWVVTAASIILFGDQTIVLISGYLVWALPAVVGAIMGVFCDMDEPIYIAQTFDDDNCETRLSRQEWFRQQVGEASERGAIFYRYSFWPDGTGLLIEGWAERPDEQGDQRWKVKPDE